MVATSTFDLYNCIYTECGNQTRQWNIHHYMPGSWSCDSCWGKFGDKPTYRTSISYIYIYQQYIHIFVGDISYKSFFCWLMSYESTFLLVISTINPHICWLISYESSHLLVISTINPHICWLDPHVYRLTGSNCGTAGVCGLAGRLPVAADQILCDGWAFSVQTLVNRRFWDFMSH
jgi:hypothetical protein